MPQEIERKFLVTGDQWKTQAQGVRYRQGYISSKEGVSVRVRIAGDQGYLTIKGPIIGCSRPEYEYPIPLSDAEELLDTLCDRPLIEKTRYTLTHQGNTWVIDQFQGDNQGLTIAEIELEQEEQTFDIPPWIGLEVTQDHRYYNSNLAKFPYGKWGK